MRVLYPLSARISDLINDGAETASGWMVLWSGFCIILLLLVGSTLSVFEGGNADKQHASFSSNHTLHSPNLRVNHKPESAHTAQAAENRIPRASTQDYIDAHRCAQSVACFTPQKSPLVMRAKPQANAGLYL